MAKARRRALGRSWPRRLGAIALLLAVAGGLFGWWRFAHWTPDRTTYRSQGFIAGEEDGPTNFRAFRQIGADFTYLEASSGARGRDDFFAENLPAAREARLKVGVIHRFDPCEPAEKQSANFVTIVPRDRSLLPPAIELDRIASDCPGHVVEAAVESELMTFLNQIESHTGKPALLKISPRFEKAYHVGRNFERSLWLERNWLPPEYAGRPWMLWTANTMLRTEAGNGAIRWVVARN